MVINCKFYDLNSFLQSLEYVKSPVFLSINIQSLNSKFDELKHFITELNSKKICIDIIAIQEVWEIRSPDLVNLPGFQPLVFKSRINMRGGGVGFYVRNGLNFSIMENLSSFETKIFESITIKLRYPDKPSPLLLTCAYKSNGQLVNMSANQQNDRFQAIFDELLHNLKGAQA